MTTPQSTTRKKLAPAARESSTTTDYPALLAEVKACLQSAQYAVLSAVNKELVCLYWDIGRLIVERQQSAGWGKAVVVQIAANLQAWLVEEYAYPPDRQPELRKIAARPEQFRPHAAPGVACASPLAWRRTPSPKHCRRS